MDEDKTAKGGSPRLESSPESHISVSVADAQPLPDALRSDAQNSYGITSSSDSSTEYEIMYSPIMSPRVAPGFDLLQLGEPLGFQQSWAPGLERYPELHPMMDTQALPVDEQLGLQLRLSSQVDDLNRRNQFGLSSFHPANFSAQDRISEYRDMVPVSDYPEIPEYGDLQSSTSNMSSSSISHERFPEFTLAGQRQQTLPFSPSGRYGMPSSWVDIDEGSRVMYWCHQGALGPQGQEAGRQASLAILEEQQEQDFGISPFREQQQFLDGAGSAREPIAELSNTPRGSQSTARAQDLADPADDLEEPQTPNAGNQLEVSRRSSSREYVPIQPRPLTHHQYRERIRSLSSSPDFLQAVYTFNDLEAKGFTLEHLTRCLRMRELTRAELAIIGNNLRIALGGLGMPYVSLRPMAPEYGIWERMSLYDLQIPPQYVYLGIPPRGFVF